MQGFHCRVSTPLSIFVVAMLMQTSPAIGQVDSDLGEASTEVSIESSPSESQEFYLIARNEPLAVVQKHLSEGADPNSIGENGYTALMGAAAKNPDPRVVQALIDAGANVNTLNKYGSHALLSAARNNAPFDVLKILIESGADVNARNDDGTALSYAAQVCTNPEIIEGYMLCFFNFLKINQRPTPSNEK